MKTPDRRRGFAIVAVALTLFVAGALTGAGEGIARAAGAAIPTISLTLNPDSQPKDVQFGQFWKAWHLLDANFVETHTSSTIPTYQERVYGAIAGLTDSFGDPYTVFFAPVEAQTFQEDIQGEFGGVGMELGLREKRIVVVAPLKDSPAEKAGIRAGDFVIGINDKSAEGLAVDEAVSKIRGKVGTTVKITLLRDGTKDPIVVSIVRDVIHIPIIKNYIRADGIYVIELYSFSANSADLFRQALRGFIESGSRKLLLDVRGNPGGYLEAAVQMASFFLPQGDIIVSEDSKGKRDTVNHRSLGYNVFAGKKLTMAVLIDQGSASASEILAGALQQHNVAKLVGERSFGKGSVQQLMDLGGGAQLKVTVARWLTPNGSSISDGGLTPDIKAERTIDDFKAGKDPQKEAAVNYLLAN